MAFRKGVLRLYGLHGLSQIAPALLEFDEEKQTGILRCSRSHLRQMRAALAYITSIDGSAAAIRVMRVSGTIKALKSA
ncbi:MAG: Rpp14/Pop5 family protein [Candidatus Bathyarchaeia archaeon]